ncbi:MAG: hypothetical protein KGK10_05845 [Rhodospirillales bacterium]|nr:hypothetical protein [Rhodospirillales bacterium]
MTKAVSVAPGTLFPFPEKDPVAVKYIPTSGYCSPLPVAENVDVLEVGNHNAEEENGCEAPLFALPENDGCNATPMPFC